MTMAEMPNFTEQLGPVEGFAHRAERNIADELRRLAHPHLHHRDAARPWPPETCGDCADGLVPTIHGACNCGSPGFPDPHERLCGYEPCPNGCWNILHPPSQTPASGPVNLAAGAAEPLKENPMFATIDDDLREDLTQGIAYGKELFARLEAKAPGIISTVDAVAGSTIGQLAEKLAGSVIPPQYEPVLVGLVDDFVRRYGQPAPVAAAPAAPATPAPAQ